MGNIQGLNHLVHHFVLGTALGGEAKHGHAGLVDAGNGLGCAGGADGNLCQLVGIGHRSYCHVAHHKHAVLAALGGVGEQQHGTAHAGDARRGLDDLQGGTEHVARRVACAGKLAVGIAALDDEAAEIKRILHQFARLFNGHALLLAQFAKQLGIRLLLRMVFGVDNLRFADISQSELLRHSSDFHGIAEQDKVCHPIGENLVGGFEGTLFRSLGKHDALAVCLGTCNELFYEFHSYNEII